MSDDDLDRAAILARRQRFIAIALSSLAVACTSRAGKPQVCLSPPMPETQGDPEVPPGEDPPVGDPPSEDPPSEEPPVEEPPVEAPPQPCLKVAPPK